MILMLLADSVSLQSVEIVSCLFSLLHAVNVTIPQADFERRVNVEVERRRKLMLTMPAAAVTGVSPAGSHGSVNSPKQPTD
jgi:hypothetical protein